MGERATWATRVGFILAAVGSAVGLGNVWRFPYLTAESGGAAFLAVYLVAVLLVGLPAVLAEFVVGRRAHQNAVDAFEQLGGRYWRIVGALMLFTGTIILSYYSVVGGWVLRYVVGSITGAYFGDPAGYFQAISTGPGAVLFHALFMALTVGIVALGVQRGIEVSTKLMVPGIVVLLVALAVWAAGLDGAAAGYEFFLSPDVSALTGNVATVVPAAVGQALFTLSLGMGAMITYASYVGEDDDLVVDGVSIVLLNTLVGILAGLVVFPLLFAQGVSVGDPGPGAIFVSIATAFQTLPFGRLLGTVFFSVVAIAALSSAISLLEVVVSYLVDNLDVRRPVLATGVGAGLFLMGIPPALNSGAFSAYDQLTGSLLLPLGVFLTVVFVGWVDGRDAVDELRRGAGGSAVAAHAWLWHVRVVLLAAVVGTLVLSVASFLGVELLT